MLIGTVTPRGWEDTPGGGKGRDGCERGGGASKKSLKIIQSTSVLWHTAACCGIHVRYTCEPSVHGKLKQGKGWECCLKMMMLVSPPPPLLPPSSPPLTHQPNSTSPQV